MGYSVKLLCGTQLLQLVNYAHGPSLEVKGKCEKRNTEQIYEKGIKMFIDKAPKSLRHDCGNFMHLRIQDAAIEENGI